MTERTLDRDPSRLTDELWEFNQTRRVMLGKREGEGLNPEGEEALMDEAPK